MDMMYIRMHMLMCAQNNPHLRSIEAVAAHPIRFRRGDTYVEPGIGWIETISNGCIGKAPRVQNLALVQSKQRLKSILSLLEGHWTPQKSLPIVISHIFSCVKEAKCSFLSPPGFRKGC